MSSLDGYSVLPFKEAFSLTAQELTDHYLHSLGRVLVEKDGGVHMDLYTFAHLLPSGRKELLENALRNANSSLESNLREYKNSLAVSTVSSTVSSTISSISANTGAISSARGEGESYADLY